MDDKATVVHVEEVRSHALQDLESAGSLEELEQWRISYLGRSGRLTRILRGLAFLSPDDRRLVGAAANQTKSLLESRLGSPGRSL